MFKGMDSTRISLEKRRNCDRESNWIENNDVRIRKVTPNLKKLRIFELPFECSLCQRLLEKLRNFELPLKKYSVSKIIICLSASEKSSLTYKIAYFSALFKKVHCVHHNILEKLRGFLSK